MQAEETIIQNMNTMFWSNGAGNGGKDMLGLNALVGTGNDSGSAIGGIDATDSDNSWWRSTLTNQGGALTLAAMSTMYNTVSVGNDQPTIIISDQDEYEKYESLLQPNLRYTSAEVADAGFQNLLFKGAPCTYDAGSDVAGKMFFLNTKYLRLVAHSETWFQPTPFVRPTNQDARYAQILCYGELTCSNRARQGMLYGLTD